MICNDFIIVDVKDDNHWSSKRYKQWHEGQTVSENIWNIDNPPIWGKLSTKLQNLNQ